MSREQKSSYRIGAETPNSTVSLNYVLLAALAESALAEEHRARVRGASCADGHVQLPVGGELEGYAELRRADGGGREAGELELVEHHQLLLARPAAALSRPLGAHADVGDGLSVAGGGERQLPSRGRRGAARQDDVESAARHLRRHVKAREGRRWALGRAVGGKRVVA